MKSLPGFIVGLILFVAFFYMLDEGLMKSQGLKLFPDDKAAEALGEH